MFSRRVIGTVCGVFLTLPLSALGSTGSLWDIDPMHSDAHFWCVI